MPSEYLNFFLVSEDLLKHLLQPIVLWIPPFVQKLGSTYVDADAAAAADTVAVFANVAAVAALAVVADVTDVAAVFSLLFSSLFVTDVTFIMKRISRALKNTVNRNPILAICHNERER